MSPTHLEGFLKENIIGNRIEVLSCKNKFNNNKSGVIVNETKNMIYISEDGNKTKINKISKKEINIYKILATGDYFINGKALLATPEEKLSKIV